MGVPFFQVGILVSGSPSNPAWLKEAQRLLEDQQRRAESLKTRGGQIAGFGAAVFALIGGNAGPISGATVGSARVAVGTALLIAVSSLAAAVAIAIWGIVKPRPFTAITADEIANYTSDRLLSEPDLWRVHLRSLHSLEMATRQAEEDGDVAAKAIARALVAFQSGLAFSLISLGTLIVELI